MFRLIVTLFTGRFAELKKTTLEFTPPDEPVLVMGSPFLFRLILFTCIDIVLKAEAVSVPIQVELATAAERTVVLVKSSPFETTGELVVGVENVRILAEKVGWLLASDQEVDGMHTFAIGIPRHPTAKQDKEHDHGE